MAKRTNRVAWGLAVVLAVVTGMWLQLHLGLNTGLVVTQGGVVFLGVRLCDSSEWIGKPDNAWQYACGRGFSRITQVRRLGPATIEVYLDYIHFR